MKAPEITNEERRKRLSLAVRCTKRHVPTRKDRLTREIEILALAAVGHTDHEIAERLAIRVSTVGAYWKRVLHRFGSRTRTEAVAAVLIFEIMRLREEIVSIRAEQSRCDSTEP